MIKSSFRGINIIFCFQWSMELILTFANGIHLNIVISWWSDSWNKCGFFLSQFLDSFHWVLSTIWLKYRSIFLHSFFKFFIVNKLNSYFLLWLDGRVDDNFSLVRSLFNDFSVIFIGKGHSRNLWSGWSSWYLNGFNVLWNKVLEADEILNFWMQVQVICVVGQEVFFNRDTVFVKINLVEINAEIGFCSLLFDPELLAKGVSGWAYESFSSNVPFAVTVA